MGTSAKPGYEHDDFAVHHVAQCGLREGTDREMPVGPSKQFALTLSLS